jgi:hypothetical protein
MPVLVLRALKAVALGWRWYRVALLLHIAYFGLFWPGEVCALKRSDILLRESAQGVEMLIRMERVKSWSRGARPQYAKVDALQCCEFGNRFVRSTSPGMRLWPGTPTLFAKRLEMLLKAATVQPGPYTPGSLRCGGATHLFLEWEENLSKLCWRGRWQNLTTLWHYVQELQSIAILQQYSAPVQQRVLDLAGLLDVLVLEWCATEVAAET